MREIAGHLADSVADSFDREQAPDGAPWKPLEPQTVRERHRQGYAAGPILDQVAENHGSPRRSSRCALTCSRVRVRVGGRFPYTNETSCSKISSLDSFWPAACSSFSINRSCSGVAGTFKSGIVRTASTHAANRTRAPRAHRHRIP